jgi:polysaccharide pyruvyl transferase WcaK-like protein
MDGFYDPSSVLGRIRLARFAEKIGIQVVVTGFSFSDNPNDQICSELQRLSSTKFYLRDGFSLSRFSRITGIKGVLSADLAFLTQSALLDKRFDAIQNWKIQQKHIDQIIVIVNANWIPFKSTFTRVEELVDAYVGLIKKLDDLYEKKISVMLFPNDYRDAENTGDINLSRLIHAGLSHVMEARVISIHDYTYNAEEARALTENCDFLVSGRMHLAIICATNGIPSMAIEYQSKFKGMYEHLGLDPESLLVSPGTFLSPGMAGEIKSIMDRKDDLRNQILARLPHVKRLAHRNFDF